MNVTVINFIINDCDLQCFEKYDIEQNKEFWLNQTYYNFDERERKYLEKYYDYRIKNYETKT